LYGNGTTSRRFSINDISATCGSRCRCQRSKIHLSGLALRERDELGYRLAGTEGFTTISFAPRNHRYGGEILFKVIVQLGVQGLAIDCATVTWRIV